ncbi:hypothetical protein SAMN05192553_102106 [Cyclobacterium xiamenense]|uniref:LTXXQ motif family protein n=1 Tax=Cyclobacterium xiamenense TaxID=1297121 RepID=A0A1H6VV50_9BACT|nr:hypothetical protein [Cyclobacterium xiamenense]SEJ04520.1 hypothetical protein SAMN05192553_102106 [Cyclobacterium xiamenense]
MKSLIIVTMLLFLLFDLQAQNDKIESARIAYITQQLNLSPEKAEKFWPIYNEFSRERRALQQEYIQVRKQYQEGELTESESEKLLELGMKLRERELQLERKYSERIASVISNRQLIALRKVENDFKRMLLERLKERRNRQEGIQYKQER